MPLIGGLPRCRREGRCQHAKNMTKEVRGREREREKMYFKELAHTVVEVGKSEIYQVGQQAGNSSRVSRLRS